MENIAIHRKEGIGMNRGDVVMATIPSDNEQLAVITQGGRAWSKTATVVVTSLEKMNDNSGDEPQHGEVYLAAISGVENEPTVLRPVIVLQNAGNGGQVLVVPMTTKMKRRKKEHVVFVFHGKLSTALLKSVRSIEQSCLLRKLGKMDDGTMVRVKDSLASCHSLRP